MHRTRNRLRGTTAAFTLVELMVVVLILGLIGGVAFASWASMLPNQQFNSAVRNLSEVLHGTRSDAIARNREFIVRYDIDNDRYRVRTPFLVGGGFATTEDDDERLWIDETNLADYGVDLVEISVAGNKFTDGLVDVPFQPLGAAAHHLIVLRQVQFEREFTIEVLPLTGEIRMHDGLYVREPAEEGDFK
jgi:prepilin-type N-terminal cleavage/methylation domain-containing protein